MVLAVCIIGAILAAAIGVLWVYANAILEQKSALEAAVARQTRELAEARRKTDMMMAELAIAEAKLKHNSQAPVAEAIRNDSESDKREPENPEPSVAPSHSPQPNTPLKHDGESAGSEQTSPQPADVSVDNAYFCYDTNTGTIHGEFKIINVMEKKQPISGYIYIILKDGSEMPDHWVAYPNTKLVNGAPVEKKGLRFRIYNYRTMKFSLAHEKPDQFRYATVSVYHQKTGDLMLERDIDIPAFPQCP